MKTVHVFVGYYFAFYIFFFSITLGTRFLERAIFFEPLVHEAKPFKSGMNSRLMIENMITIVEIIN